MKILILSDDFPPSAFGGAGRVAYNLARGLQDAGHQVFIITTCREKSNEGREDYEGLNVFRIYSNFHARWRAYLGLYNPRTVSRVRRFIKEIKPDVVHAHNVHCHLSYHCLKVAKNHSRAVFLTAHDVAMFNYEKLAAQKYLENSDCRTIWLDHLKQAQKRYNPLRNVIIRYYLKYVDKIFAVSYALKDALNQNGISNIEVIHNGINPEDWSVSLELVEGFRKKHDLQDKKVIFFGGRISALKGSEKINQAIARVKKEIPEVFLFVIGRGTKWLTGGDLKAAYAVSEVVVTPSIYLDPFPTVNLEAMASRRPVVATCYGGSLELVRDGVTGFIINPANTELMAEKIIDLLKNPQKAKQFGEAGFERVKKEFSLEQQVAKTISWYLKFL